MALCTAGAILSVEPVLHDLAAHRGEHALGMELYAVDVVVAVTETHDLPVVTDSRHLE